ncbi:MAG: 4Fe-4S dicluster domain-containing protein [Bacteroidales bacterium]|jgi:heterodisulfide reductase subunit C|nr:4Fe-4S dicluster domain-containing protein [Bacteroidales bacterium]
MKTLYEQLAEDVRFREGMNACINCGTCTAICPAAEFYDYDPRRVVDLVQSKNDAEIERLLRSETIWYCGECMSCVTRCPRNNAPGLIIMAMRSLSQELGFFTDSEKGRQQLALKRNIGESILNTGYCLYLRNISYEAHPEAGPIWDWSTSNADAVYKRLGGNLDGEGPGVLRKIPQADLDELKRIFDITGGTKRYNKIEEYSAKKAAEMGLSMDEYMSLAFNGKN